MMLIHCMTAGCIVAECQKINRPFFQNTLVLLGDSKCFYIDTLAFQIMSAGIGIFSAYHHVPTIPEAVHALLCFNDIHGVTGIWVMRIPRNHGTDLKVRIDVMTCLYSQRTGDKLMMQSRKAFRHFICRQRLLTRLCDIQISGSVRKNPTCIYIAEIICHHIDFIKRDPILHFIPILAENRFTVRDKGRNRLSA